MKRHAENAFTNECSSIEDQMDGPFSMSSRKRRTTRPFDAPPAKHAYKGADVCDPTPNSSFVTFTPRFDSSINPLASKENNIVSVVRNFHPTIVNYLTETNSFFSLDSLVSVLNAAKVTPGKRILVYDEYGGLVTVSTLKLLKGEGEVWFLYEKFSSQSSPAFKAMDYGKEVNAFRPVRLSTVTTIAPSELPSASDSVVNEDSMDCEDNHQTLRARRLEFIPEKADILPKFDSIIIASDMISPASFLEKFYGFLIPSASIAIYTHSQDEAQMIQAFLVAVNAKNLIITRMSTYFKSFLESPGFFISAIKSS